MTATDRKRWTVEDFVRGALTYSHPVSERVVAASVPPYARSLVPRVLNELVERDVVISHGPKTRRTYLLKGKN